MAIVQSGSGRRPSASHDATTAWLAVRAVARAQAMGLLGTEGPPRHLLAEHVSDALEAFVAAGIGADHALALLDGTRRDQRELWERLHDAVEASPHPDGEWTSVTTCLGDELVWRIVGVSPSSVLRYRSRLRRTPDQVASRLHLLALVVADLGGSYNARGMRRWFERSRPQLEGSAPEHLLSGDWDPADPDAQRVARLAAALTGAGSAT